MAGIVLQEARNPGLQMRVDKERRQNWLKEKTRGRKEQIRRGLFLKVRKSSREELSPKEEEGEEEEKGSKIVVEGKLPLPFSAIQSVH